MSSAGYAQFLRCMGHRVHQAAGVWWFDVYPRTYMPFPFQALVAPDAVRAEGLLRRRGWLALRYPCAVERGRPSYRLVCRACDYGLASLGSKARNQTRRALERCECRALDFAELAASGPELNRDTLVRQGRKIGADFDAHWQRYYRCAGEAEGADAWGCFAEGRLAAYLVAFRMEASSHVLIVRSHSELLRHYPNNALLYTYLRRCFDDGLEEVSIGFEPLQDEMESLDHFKLGMGFEQLPVGQRIEFAPWLAPLLPAAGALARLLPRGEARAKLAGMLRWHREQPLLD